jgi:hypothetical protein
VKELGLEVVVGLGLQKDVNLALLLIFFYEYAIEKGLVQSGNKKHRYFITNKKH